MQFLLSDAHRADGAVMTWVNSEGGCAEMDIDNGAQLLIWTLEGTHIVSLGDWVVQGIEGEFWAVKPHIFEQTYEAA